MCVCLLEPDQDAVGIQFINVCVCVRILKKFLLLTVFGPPAALQFAKSNIPIQTFYLGESQALHANYLMPLLT